MERRGKIPIGLSFSYIEAKEITRGGYCEIFSHFLTRLII